MDYTQNHPVINYVAPVLPINTDEKYDSASDTAEEEYTEYELEYTEDEKNEDESKDTEDDVQESLDQVNDLGWEDGAGGMFSLLSLCTYLRY